MDLSALERFSIYFSKTQLDDLSTRLAATRWPELPFDVGWKAGTNDSVLRELVGYWRTAFDWHGVQEGLNRLERTIRAVLPAMRAQRSGTFVNVSSVAGRLGPSCMGVYSASKFALEAASESLAREVFPHGIRVVIIEPGIIVTPILEKALANLPPEADSPYEAPIRRTRKLFSQGQSHGGHPDLVAGMIEQAIAAPVLRLRYLAGDDAEVLVGGRSRMSDEDWISMERHVTDEAYFAEFATRFPMPPTP